MKCFEITRLVLDDSHQALPGTDAQRKKLIIESMESMSDTYRNKLLKQGGPDFAAPEYRYAYVYTYVPAHADWVCDLMSKDKAMKSLFKRESVDVTCLGG